MTENLRRALLLAEQFWRDRAQWYRVELGNLDAAHKCELRADSVRDTGRIFTLYGYEP